MSVQLFDFLFQKIVDDFTSQGIEAGDRFHVHLEKDSQVSAFYEAACRKAREHVEYKGLSIPAINVGEVQLLVSSENTGCDHAFLTRLRNLVTSTEEPLFENKCLLILHYTPLDSIIDGAGTLTREGAPLHHVDIETALSGMIEASSFTGNEKLLLATWLTEHSSRYINSTTAILEYGPILDAIRGESFTTEMLNGLGYFRDCELNTIDNAKEVENRLKDNHWWFDRISTLHQYSADISDDLDKDFTKAGIDNLKAENFRETCSYGQVKKWHDEKKSKIPPSYLEQDALMTEQGLMYWEKKDGERGAKSRQHNIVIFNPSFMPKVEFELLFDSEIIASGIKTQPINGGVNGNKRGKRIVVEICDCETFPKFARIEYTDPESKQVQRFTFVVLPVKSKAFDRCSTIFQTIVFKKKVGDCVLAIQTVENIVFNDNGMTEERHKLAPGLSVDLHKEDIKYVIELDGSDDSESIPFFTTISGANIPFELRQETVRPKNISGLNIWKQKREKQRHFEYLGDNRLSIGNEEYYVAKQIAVFLNLEQQIVQQDTNDCYWIRTKNGLQPRDLDIADELRNAYKEIISKLDGRLPSLTRIDSCLRKLMEHYVGTFIDLMDGAIEGSKLNIQTQNLLKFCTVQQEDGEQRVYFTPLHPLNIAYQLALLDHTKEEDLPAEMLRSMSPQGLLPFINSPFGHPEEKFCPLDELELREWTVYRNHKSIHQDQRNEYTERLIGEKITEYVRHFQYLFTGAKGAPVRINLVNLGDCIDALQGILTYFRNSINACEGDLDKVLPVHVCIHGETGPYNQFEQFSHYPDVDEIEEIFEVSLKTKDVDKSEVLRVIRERLKFYVKPDGDDLAYSHITFFKFDNTKTKWTYHGTDVVGTGCSLDGLVSAVPSVYLQDEYKTGFGRKDLPIDKSPLIRMAERLNAIAQVAYTPDPFSPGNATFAVIQSDQREGLDQLYAKSNWVTFIEPKVDLNFFKMHDSTKDLIIIHYSDQYSSASGYDAITVTRKSRQYQALIHEFLTEHGLDSSDTTELSLINMFNAINGDWLLRLISGDTRGGSYFPKEKISILSAVKSTLAVLAHSDIAWIPLSLEEILRVSGGIGLKQTAGLFSTKNLGKRGRYCDDLLMAGLEVRDGALFVHMLPVEVKIGQNNATMIEKGKEQGKETAKILREFLTPNEDNFRAKFYRSFFARLILVGAEKLDLYDLAESPETIEQIRTQRRSLLNDDFTIAWDLQHSFASYGVVSFRNDDFARRLNLENEGFLLELLESDGYTNLAKTVKELAELYQNPNTTIKQEYLLRGRFHTGIDLTSEEANGPAQPTPDVKPEIEKPRETEEAEPGGDATMEPEGLPPVSPRPEGMRILFGHDVNNNAPVNWFPNDTNRVMHTNTGIIGTMGTGKTQFTKSLITQLVRESKNNVNGTKLGFLIFDYKGDYIKDDFMKATGAKRYDLHHLPYNPLTLTLGSTPQPMLPLHTANAIKESIATAFHLGEVQKQKLRDCIMAAYEGRGIYKGEKGSWSQPAPTLSDVCDIYLNDDDTKQDSLYAAMDNLYQFEIFEPDPAQTKSLWDLLDGVVVINLSGYDQNIQNLVVAITLDLFYSQMQKSGHSTIQGNMRELTKMVLVDEADNFLSQNFQAIRRILKEGREFGVGTILSTQFLNHFSTSDNEYSNYILTWVVHRVSEISTKEVNALFGLPSRELSTELQSNIMKLEKHLSVASLADGRAKYIRDRAFWEIVKA